MNKLRFLIFALGFLCIGSVSVSSAEARGICIQTAGLVETVVGPEYYLQCAHLLNDPIAYRQCVLDLCEADPYKCLGPDAGPVIACDGYHQCPSDNYEPNVTDNGDGTVTYRHCVDCGCEPETL